LFGGEGVEVVPSSRKEQNAKTQTPAGTLEISVRLSNVTIRSHATFDVYAKPVSDECEPLIQLITTTTESIALQEVRARDVTDDEEDDTDPNGATHLVLREMQTSTTGWKSLSIRPASYEKVEEWSTPS